MNSSIKTYENLEQEERRLQTHLISHREIISQDIANLKDGLNPVKRVVSTAKNLFTRGDNGPLLNFGVNFGLDVFLRRIILGRASWLTKTVVPYVVKNYASHLVTEDQRKNVGKTVSKFLTKILMKKKKETLEAAPPAMNY